ncbi:hypothetical protein HBI23_230570 [Parastagonospora nodorum]|nr:hypothetical protein HBH42_119900 [Parastagonospora nodorum]KAH5431152.1 hypothetical protein HBI47_110600 [Parastagonospora nodorum]KAH5625875.1 hypothetical protein HBI23_230570 [Parastagonospora nodorum]KAH6346033.1 hypothetical protein HBI37_078660 [Parastagonospora nodorum]KAH6352119.1 hypothetical protein HBI36_110890 [Parastagonospora nodorum]
MQNTSWDRIKCPTITCSILLNDGEMQLCALPLTYTRYQELSARSVLNNDPEFQNCLRPGCSSGQFHNSDSDGNIFCCHECGFLVCTTHNEPFHTGETCKEYDCRTKSIRKVEDDASIRKIERTAKKCPGNACGIWIQKNQGCDHMTCRQCRFQFCWVCLAPYSGQGGIFQDGNSAHAWTCPHFREVGGAMPVEGFPPVHLSDTEDDADDNSDDDGHWDEIIPNLERDIRNAAQIADVAVGDPEISESDDESAPLSPIILPDLSENDSDNDDWVEALRDLVRTTRNAAQMSAVGAAIPAISESDDATTPPSPIILSNRSGRAASALSIWEDKITHIFDYNNEEHGPIPISDDEQPVPLPRTSPIWTPFSISRPPFSSSSEDDSGVDFIAVLSATKRKTIGSHSVDRSKRTATLTAARPSAAPEVLAAKKSLNRLSASSALRKPGAKAVFRRL